MEVRGRVFIRLPLHFILTTSPTLAPSGRTPRDTSSPQVAGGIKHQLTPLPSPLQPHSDPPTLKLTGRARSRRPGPGNLLPGERSPLADYSLTSLPSTPSRPPPPPPASWDTSISDSRSRGGACPAPCPAPLVMWGHGRGWKEQLSALTRPQSHGPARRPAVPEQSPAPIRLHQGPGIRKQ